MSRLFFLHTFVFIAQFHIQRLSGETVSGCTVNTNNRRTANDKTSVTLSCPNNGFILVRNLTFGVHKSSSMAAASASSPCTYQPGDCTTRTTYIGMECNGLTTCDLDLNPQYLHICSQYSDYMVLDYSCLQGSSLSVCDNRLISTSLHQDHRLFLRSPNYPHEYDNSLNCSCQIQTRRAQVKFLDFYLEERDEMNICSRDHLQIDNRSYCGSAAEENNQVNASTVTVDASFQLAFKSNDVITRKGFWLMVSSEQPLQVSCNNLIESSSTVAAPSSTSTTTTTTTKTAPVQSATSVSASPATEASILNLANTDQRRHTLSYILILTIVFVVVLLLLNLLLIILCWRQRRPKAPTDSKSNDTNRPFFCSIRSSTSSSSSVTYGETPVLNSLDGQKQQTLSTRYIFQPNQQHLDTTPSTSTTTATGPYEDLNDSMTLQRQLIKSKPTDTHSLHMQHRPMFSSPSTAYNRMVHFPPAPIRCHFSTPVQTFYPPQPFLDSQHIYETIQDGHCPYQRLAATLRRQHPPACTCSYEHTVPHYPSRTCERENVPLESTPETLV